MKLKKVTRLHSKIESPTARYQALIRMGWHCGECGAPGKHRVRTHWPFPRRSLFAILVAALVGFALQACSTPTTRFGSEDPIGDYKNSRADGAAWAAEGFSFRKHMPLRPANDFEFYYKHCDLTGDEAFTSKTSYWCTSP